MYSVTSRHCWHHLPAIVSFNKEVESLVRFAYENYSNKIVDFLNYLTLRKFPSQTCSALYACKLCMINGSKLTINAHQIWDTIPVAALRLCKHQLKCTHSVWILKKEPSKITAKYKPWIDYTGNSNENGGSVAVSNY